MHLTLISLHQSAKRSNIITLIISSMAILHRKLASEAEAGGEYSNSSPPPAAAAAHTNHAIPYLVSAACVLGVAFLLLTTCTILLRHRCSRRRRVSSTSPHSNDDHQGPVDHPIWHIVTVGLPQSVINSIAAVSYKSCDGPIEGSDCSVCLTKFEDGDAVRLLPKCSHAFHLPCIDTWLRSHKNCPLCRAPVVDDSTPNSGPSESNPVGNSENPSEETAAADDDDVETWPVQVQGAGIAGIWKSDPVKRTSSDVGENVSAVDEDMQPVRRSISLDSSAACEYEVNKPKVVNGEGSSEQQHMVEEEVDDKEGHSDSAISRMMKRSLSSLSPFRGSKSHSSSSSSSSTLPL